jgi:hypothetical protein
VASFLLPRRGTGSRNVLAFASVLAACAGCLLVFSPATPVFAAGTLSMSPTHGPPGTSITLSGTDFKSSATVTISFNDVVAASAVTDRSGAFRVIFAAPSSSNGTYPISVSDGVNTVNLAFTIDSSSTTTTTSTSTSNSTSLSTKTTTITTTVTATVTTTSVTKVTTTSTTTVTSLSTTTTTRPGVTVTSTSTSTKNYTTTDPGAPVTATETMTQTAAAATITVSVTKSSSDPAAAQSSLPFFGSLSDTLLYFLAGVGIMVTAISVGVLAHRERTIKDYTSEKPSRESST